MTETTAHSLASHLCHDVVSEVVTRHGRSYIITTFEYPDGDLLALHTETRAGKLWVSDAGQTAFKFKVDGLKLTDARLRMIANVCNVYGVTGDSRGFARPVSDENPGADCLRLCEAITRISTLEFAIDDHAVSEFKYRVDRVLVARFTGVRKWKDNWVDQHIDPKRAFPIDYHFNGAHPPRNLFRVSSPYKAALVAAVIGHYRTNGVNVPAMSIIDPAAKLSEIHISRVTSASTEVCFDVDERRIVDFILEPR